MNNPKKYGNPPFRIAVIHGGPGAGGEMAPIAKRLSKTLGVLEPIQTKNTLKGQVEELRKILEKNAKIPATLIGWSWGAWLSFIVAARHPSLVKKLILVSSGPFDEKYAKNITKLRISRLSKNEKVKFKKLIKKLSNPKTINKNALMSRLGKLTLKTDSHSLLPHKNTKVKVRHDIHTNIWKEAGGLRKSGKLLNLGKHIKCPVVAIHGDYDPHPAVGVKKPLSSFLKDFKFILLKNCGHYPWYEKGAKNKFFKILDRQLKTTAFK